MKLPLPLTTFDVRVLWFDGEEEEDEKKRMKKGEHILKIDPDEIRDRKTGELRVPTEREAWEILKKRYLRAEQERHDAVYLANPSYMASAQAATTEAPSCTILKSIES